MADPSVRLELLKNKKKNAQSAIASQEVLEHLAGFIRSKRQGSINQLASVSSNLNGDQTGDSRFAAQEGSLSGCDYTNPSLLNAIPLDDDHPLRKTASMPTMHIPYKAQTMSRRRQVERRTTMSPLMRRKSKPKRQLLELQSSPNQTEISSNPCILQSYSSLVQTQSNSPPSSSKHNGAQPNTQHKLDIQQESNLSQASNQLSDGISLRSLLTNQDLKSLQNQSLSVASANTNIIQLRNLPNNDAGNFGSEKNNCELDEQQRSILTESCLIRTNGQRNLNGARLNQGKSLDHELTAPSSFGLTKDGAADKRANHGQNQLRFREESRQWSLDGPEIGFSQLARFSSTAVPVSNSSSALLTGFIDPSERKQQRLGVSTSDSTPSRIAFSSSASSTGQIPTGKATISNQLNSSRPKQHGQLLTSFDSEHQAMFGDSSQTCVISHSSTKPESIDSDNLESMHAMDLSSPSRQRSQQVMNQDMISTQIPTETATQNEQPHSSLTQAQYQHYQRVLQESFRQMQLCQSQDELQHLLLNSPATQAQSSDHKDGPPVLTSNTMATPNYRNPEAVPVVESREKPRMSSGICEQPQVMTNNYLINVGDQQYQRLPASLYQAPEQVGVPMFGPQLNLDPNQWLMAREAFLIQNYGHRLAAGGSLVSRLANSELYRALPELYKTSLLAHLFKQQQNQLSLMGFDPTFQPDYAFSQRIQRSTLGRTLSSPTLLASSTCSNFDPNRASSRFGLFPQTFMPSRAMNQPAFNYTPISNNMSSRPHSSLLAGPSNRQINSDATSMILDDGIGSLQEQPMNFDINLDQEHQSLDLSASSRSGIRFEDQAKHKSGE